MASAVIFSLAWVRNNLVLQFHFCELFSACGKDSISLYRCTIGFSRVLSRNGE